MQENKQYSDDFLDCVRTIDNIPCFVKLNQSKYVVVAIHQHLGLVQNFCQIVTKFVHNSASIIIPDLFCNIQEDKIDQANQFSALVQLNLSDVHLILKKCVQYAKNKKKLVILLGFSIGASLGLKLIEKLDELILGVFFYGYPIAKQLSPQKINCPVVIFHAQKDKIKYLSDQQHFKKVLGLYKDQPHIEIQQISASHGFMNPQHPNFDQKAFKYCRKIFNQYISQLQTQQMAPKKQKNNQNNQQKKQEGGCSIF